jgi:hypothetical protein
MPVGDRTISDAIWNLNSPTLSFVKGTARSSFVSSYMGEFELFAKHRELNAWNHAAGVRYTRELSRRVKLEIGDAFESTRDPARWLSGGHFIMPRSIFRENDAYVNLDFRISPVTSLGLRFDSTYAVAKPIETGLNLFENRTFSQSASLSRLLTRRNKINFTYGYLRVDPLGPPITEGISMVRNAHSVSMAHVFSSEPDFSFSLGAGLLRTTVNSYSVYAHLMKRLGFIRVRGRYARQFAVFAVIGAGADSDPLVPGFAGALLPSAVVDTGSIEILGHIGRRIGFNLRGSYANNNSALTTRDIRTFIGQSRIDYKLSDHLYLLASAELYRQNLAFPLGAPTNRARYLGGIEFVLSPRRVISEEFSALPALDRGGNSLLRADTLAVRPADRRKEK